MKNISRRNFLKSGAVAAAGLTIVPGTVMGKAFGHTAPSDKLNIAGIGVGGGRRNLANMKTENIVALATLIGNMPIKPSKIILLRRSLKTGGLCSTNSANQSMPLWLQHQTIHMPG